MSPIKKLVTTPWYNSEELTSNPVDRVCIVLYIGPQRSWKTRYLDQDLCLKLTKLILRIDSIVKDLIAHLIQPSVLLPSKIFSFNTAAVLVLMLPVNQSLRTNQSAVFGLKISRFITL